MKTVIIGGVADGSSSTTRFRRLNETHGIIIYERKENIPYTSCALPYYLGGVITDRDSLIEHTPEILKTKGNVDVFTKYRITAIGPPIKRLTIKDLPTSEKIKTDYDKLIISFGTRPDHPDVPGAFEAESDFILRSVTDADRIESLFEEKNSQHIIILGTGVMDLELAESFKYRGSGMTSIDQLPQVVLPYDLETVNLVYDKLLEEGSAVHLETRVTEIRDEGREMVLSDGSILSADMLIFTVGVFPKNGVVEVTGI